MKLRVMLDIQMLLFGGKVDSVPLSLPLSPPALYDPITTFYSSASADTRSRPAAAGADHIADGDAVLAGRPAPRQCAQNALPDDGSSV